MPGYRPIPSSDPHEQELREQWYKATGKAKETIGNQLAAYLWQRTESWVAEDRRRHPKAKRNQPVPTDIVVGETRALL